MASGHINLNGHLHRMEGRKLQRAVSTRRKMNSISYNLRLSTDTDWNGRTENLRALETRERKKTLEEFFF
ncbi:Hypothetical protein FKW44_010506 [Caligus rogercresseyi]|uniref:Uncharacterized protein n=1 Tax=Caligus rogercresseyi TaxID=217165 RepID=A0A7T8HGP4_CALRO|nr:Hypothetical protein FKW44_010506 [Caligus rogercresseyi]